MKKTLSQHPLVKMAPSQWAKLCDARRAYEIRKALRETGAVLNSTATPQSVTLPGS
jgi:hypothetical protein